MRNSRTLVALIALAISWPALSASLQVADFQALPQDQQRQIVDSSYNAVAVTLAFTSAETKGNRASKQLTSCLRDRDTDWVMNTVREYLAQHGSLATSVGGAITQAMMWKCGVLTFKDEQ